MSLVQCPECGAKISEKAKRCPHCGYEGEDPSLAICKANDYEITPAFKFELSEWNPGADLAPSLPREENKALVDYFGDWENILKAVPAVAQDIMAMAQGDTILAAKMTPYVKMLIAQGKLAFQFDKQGECMAVLKDVSKQKWAKQLRLEEAQVNPQFAQSLNNLTSLAYMAQILNEIEAVRDAIQQLHIELQNDRLALAEAARDRLLQAQEIQDTRLREAAIIAALGSATDAKRQLMKSFEQQRLFIERNSDKDMGKLLRSKPVDLNSAASEAFQGLVAITNAVQVEFQGHAMLGEYEASEQSLLQFRDFIKQNKLDNRDTLLMINGALKKKQINLVEDFSTISKQIENIDAAKLIEEPPQNLLPTPEPAKEEGDDDAPAALEEN